MARSDRSETRRRLGFESLETKASPSWLVPFGGTDDLSVTAQTHGTEAITNRFLQHIANLDDISIERAIPSDAEARVADTMLVNVSSDLVT